MQKTGDGSSTPDVGAALPLLVVAALARVIALLLVLRRRPSVAGFFAAGSVGSAVTAWGVGQHPWMQVDQLAMNDPTGAEAPWPVCS